MSATSNTPQDSSENQTRRTLNDRLYHMGETVSTAFLSPKGPGFFRRWFFRFPVYFYRIGFARMLGKYVLLLTTTGRKTGKPRTVALEYTYDEADDTYFIVSGWGERSHWYRNLKARPKVQVRVGNRRFDCVVERTEESRAVEVIKEVNRRNPRAERLWPKATGVPFDGSEESLREIARRCPILALKPSA